MASVGDSGDSIRLNITPMMDVFSILITFLLMSYSTDPINVDPKDGIELPKSLTLSTLDEVPTISVGKTSVIINDRPIVEVLPDGDVPASEQDQGAIRKVYEELKLMKERADEIRKAQGKAQKPGTLTFEMDRNHNFKLAKRVMLSAQQAEFVTFKLMVKKEAD